MSLEPNHIEVCHANRSGGEERETDALYKPLDPGQIRILVVEGIEQLQRPGSKYALPDLAIRCRLIISEHGASKDVHGRYVALSYVWGSPSRDRYALCDGKLVAITANLFNALWHIVVDAEVLPLNIWVDALCINQDDNLEKGRQVGMMHSIYQHAKYVIAWLGSEAENSSRELNEFWIWLDAMQQYQKEMMSTPKKRVFDAADEFLRHCAWFRRIWTFQEIVLARQAFLKIGHHTIDWDTLSSISFAEIEGAHSLKHTVAGIYEQVYQARTVSERLLPLLIANAERVATDPRDRIFAILGIYTGKGKIMADYNAPIEDVNAQVAAIIAREQGHLGFLTMTDPAASQPGSQIEFSSKISKGMVHQVDIPRVTTDVDGRVVSRVPCVSWIPDFIQADRKTLSRLNQTIADYTPDLHILCREFTMLLSVRRQTLSLAGILLGYWTTSPDLLPSMASAAKASKGVLRAFPECVRDAARRRDVKFIRHPFMGDPKRNSHVTEIDSATMQICGDAFFGCKKRPGGGTVHRSAYKIYHELLRHERKLCDCGRSESKITSASLFALSRSSSSRQEKADDADGEATTTPEQVWCCLLLGSVQPYLLRARCLADEGRIECSLVGTLPRDTHWAMHLDDLSRGYLQTYKSQAAGKRERYRLNVLNVAEAKKFKANTWTSPEHMSASLGFDMSWIRVDIDLVPE